MAKGLISAYGKWRFDSLNNAAAIIEEGNYRYIFRNPLFFELVSIVECLEHIGSYGSLLAMQTVDDTAEDVVMRIVHYELVAVLLNRYNTAFNNPYLQTSLYIRRRFQRHFNIDSPAALLRRSCDNLDI